MGDRGCQVKVCLGTHHVIDIIYSLLEFTRATSIDQLLVRRVITVQFTVIYYQGMKWYRQLFITVLSTQI